MLKDVLDKNLEIVFCGTARGTTSAMKGFYYAGPGNQFYPILHKAGFTPNILAPKDCYNLNDFKIGLTDLVHAQHGNDDVLLDENYDIAGFLAKMKIYTPKIIAFNGKKSASFALGFNGKTKYVSYGLQKQTIDEAKVYVLPSSSGSARKYWDEGYWFELKSLIITIK